MRENSKAAMEIKRGLSSETFETIDRVRIEGDIKALAGENADIILIKQKSIVQIQTIDPNGMTIKKRKFRIFNQPPRDSS